MAPRRRGGRREDGGVLLGVMLLTMMLTAISVTMTLSGQTELLIARSDESAAQAHAAAEAGLNHAVDVTLVYLEQWQTNGFSSQSAAVAALLQGPDSASGTAETDIDNGSLEELGIPRPPTTVPLAGIFGVSYEARVFDEDDPARGLTLSGADTARIGEDGIATSDTNTGVVIQAIGYGPSAASVTLETMIGVLSPPAILVNGSLEMAGTSDIGGTPGGVHANADLLISGAPDIEGDATATGSYNESGNPDIGGHSGGGYAGIPVPAVRAIDYRSNADVVMTAGGVVTDLAGNPLCDASGDGDACEDPHGWTFNGAAGWEYSDRNHLGGAFYIDTDAEISNSQGAPGSPITLTVIAQGSIDVSGRPNTVPSAAGLAFVTDMDLRFGGGANYTVEGQMLVHEQFSIQGGPELVGQITVENAAAISDLVTENQITGGPTITSNGGASGSVGVTAWREVR